jgi:hypothetical protein
VKTQANHHCPHLGRPGTITHLAALSSTLPFDFSGVQLPLRVLTFPGSLATLGWRSSPIISATPLPAIAGPNYWQGPADQE